MQSGISASADLHDAFASFAADSTLFAFPVTISSESLSSLPAIPFPNSSPSTTLTSSLSSLEPILSPTVPLYLLLRTSPTPTAQLIAATYIPSRAPVRQKTLFASTRATLVRELGSEKFADTVFLTEKEEVLDPKTWADSGYTSGGPSGGSGGGRDTALLSVEERELQAVKRAEEEARHGTAGRDLMNEGGSGAAFGGGSRDGTPSAGAGGRSGVSMKISEDARQGLAAAKAAQDPSGDSGSGVLVQFGIDIANETITQVGSPQSNIAARVVHARIPGDRPSYSLYVPGGVQGALFIYVCPGTSKVKERMLYASSGRFFVHYAKTEFGVDVVKRLEASEPADLDGERVPEEVAALSGGGAGGNGGGVDSAPGSGTATPRGEGFARPKRPGKR
ncbi:uncharacterized protein A1O9_05122 [Exophiala aquamarina CBS 119918]|uniref:ADF-H domain-containing protein n=1 Tax=Exophiala aquamarina CBS 119918 TaxID=1182545 RepID=A0A072PKN5_9EURO|nr:uncharacterized protein A1O9_05122 [Exophiala aquamarina CBS 119918]KEF60272.1 hypothetical protein A1O9_05122 [Exophiala aquamarina CBS 119918]